VKKLLIFVALVAIAWFAWNKFTSAAAPQRTAGADVEVVLYATDWCGYCRKAKEFFAKNGIAYVELDIEKDGHARQMYQHLDGRGVPLIVVGETVVRGYDEAALKLALGL